MAKSLVCNDCGKILTSITEAQNHSEVTGHVNFEESTSEVKVLVCTECGKPCRSQADRDLHTKFTGHASYEEKETAEINTEAAAKQLADASKDGDDEHMAEATPSEPEELVPPTVNETLMKELEEMGFPLNRATRALHFSRNENLEAAVNWIVENEGTPDIDTPLLVPKPRDTGPPLSAAEARKKAEELVRKAKERREKEEREQALLREKERIRAGKELLEAKRKEEDGALRRMVELRQREKEEEAKAREKIRRRLEEDRKERRRKLGLPEELTEEEKAREAERQAKEVEAEKAKHLPVVTKPITVLEKVRIALVTMKKSCEGQDAGWQTGATTLGKYLTNIINKPDEDKFRTINLSNAAFQQRVAAISGGLEFLMLCGFKESAGMLKLATEDCNMELLRGANGEVEKALSNPFFGVL